MRENRSRAWLFFRHVHNAPIINGLIINGSFPDASKLFYPSKREMMPNICCITSGERKKHLAEHRSSAGASLESASITRWFEWHFHPIFSCLLAGWSSLTSSLTRHTCGGSTRAENLRSAWECWQEAPVRSAFSPEIVVRTRVTSGCVGHLTSAPSLFWLVAQLSGGNLSQTADRRSHPAWFQFDFSHIC